MPKVVASSGLLAFELSDTAQSVRVSKEKSHPNYLESDFLDMEPEEALDVLLANSTAFICITFDGHVATLEIEDFRWQMNTRPDDLIKDLVLKGSVRFYKPLRDNYPPKR